MRVGSFVPTQSVSTLYAMAGDDCSLHFDLADLTPKQQADHEANQVLTGFLQVALIGIGKPEDSVALYDTFREEPWLTALDRYQSLFEALGLRPIAPGGRQWHPRDTFYQSVSAREQRAQLLNLYLISGSNRVLHQNQQALDVSRDLNSKFHFAANAPAFGLATPETLVMDKAALSAGAAAAFFVRHSDGVMLKTLGLAGSRNVFAVDSVESALQHLTEYADSMPVLLQQKLDLSRYTEMTVDLTVTDTSVSVSNVRRLLFADGLWVGNQLGGEVSLSAEHEEKLLEVGGYAQQHGYGCPEGSNCGVDYFIAGDELLVTEINARWTGGLFPAELLRQAGWAGNAVAFIDLVHREEFDSFQAFLKSNLHGRRSDFGLLPMGFSPFEHGIDGEPYVYVWQIVTGDFEAFKAACAASLGRRSLPTAALITLA